MNNQLNLYEHNQRSYDKVKTAFESGQDIVGIVHSTGTGKSFNALSLAYDNKDKEFIYVVPSLAIVEHLEEVIKSLGLDRTKDFSNIKFRTYQALANLYKNDREELGKNRLCNLELDYLILDEFHHIGAPVWGAAVNEIINTHENLKVFGMTAYTVRDRGTAFECDMALDDGEEIFSGNIVSKYDLVDAMMEGILPKPVYRSGYIHLKAMTDDLEKRLDSSKLSNEDKIKYKEILIAAKKRIHEADDISSILKKNIKENGKYIYFCPVRSVDEENDINTIMEEVKKELLKFVPEDKLMLYKTTSKDGKIGKDNRDAFYTDTDLNGKDVSDKLQIMFAINQYNEGVHAPNIDGVILGRGTQSDIVYFEQIGRALSTDYKEHPLIIDLTNNIDFIRELETNLKDRVREELTRQYPERRMIFKHIEEVNFDIILENIDLYNVLLELKEKVSFEWNDYYELLVKYYNHYGNSDVLQNFKTNNGIIHDESGKLLGTWVNNQRTAFKNNKLSVERIELLKKVDFAFELREKEWLENYKLLEKYCNHYRTSNVPRSFKTEDGINYDKSGKFLGQWVNVQRNSFKNNELSVERIELLQKVDFVFENLNEKNWLENYKLLENYYEHHGNSDVLTKFKTKDGVNYDESGIALGRWGRVQRDAFKNNELSVERIELLKKVNFVFENLLEKEWLENYKLLEKYYNHYGNSNVTNSFKTEDGINYDESGEFLGQWVSVQRKFFKNNELSVERKALLKKVDFVFENLNEKNWLENYKLLEKYYNHYGNSDVLQNFKTNNGIIRDESGKLLGSWVKLQKAAFKNDKLSAERIKLLKKLGFIFIKKENDDSMKLLCEKYNINYNKYKKSLNISSVDFVEFKILYLMENNMPLEENNQLHEIFSMSNENMQAIYGVTMQDLYEKYNDKSKNI